MGYERRFNPALRLVQRGSQTFVSSILEGQPEPPMYFARMKQINRSGPPLLDCLPAPNELDSGALSELCRDRPDLVVLDTRRDRRAFMREHIERSLYAPLDKTFPATVGSYVAADQGVVLVCESREVEEAVRSLIRIGIDRVLHFVSPAALKDRLLQPWLTSTRVIDFKELKRLGTQVRVLDVRGASEFNTGHWPGALNLAHTRLRVLRDQIPQTRLAVHCQTGTRAAVASAFLESLGADLVYVDDAFAEAPRV